MLPQQLRMQTMQTFRVSLRMQLLFGALDRVARILVVGIGIYLSTKTLMKNTSDFLPRNLAISSLSSSSSIRVTSVNSFTGRYCKHHLARVRSLEQTAYAGFKKNMAINCYPLVVRSTLDLSALLRKN